MTTPTLARRAAAVSASFVLALGACGVAASAAFADGSPTVPVGASAEPTDAPEAGDPTYTLTNNGAGSFSLAITIPGTSIAVDYTVDPTGAVTGATTSTAGASVAVDGHDLTITLADGRAVKVELGDAGDAVKEVSVDEQNGDNNNDQTQQGDNKDQQGNNDQGQQGDNTGQQGDNQDPAPASQPAAAPTASDSSSGDHQDSQSNDSSGTSESSSGSSDSSGGGSDSGN